MLITFSGLDGAGKTSIITWLRDELERRRRPTVVLHLNDNVGVYALARAVRDRLFGAKPEGPPRMEPLPTRLGRVRDGILWSKSLRRLLYPIDLLVFLALRLYVEWFHRRVLIMDRYFYDRLVDVADDAPRGERWLKWLARITPTPDLPVLLEISPEEAFARKGEYTVAYLRRRYSAYHRVFPLVPTSLTIADREPEAVRHRLARAVRDRMIA
jgi:thymidylate kinase